LNEAHSIDAFTLLMLCLFVSAYFLLIYFHYLPFFSHLTSFQLARKMLSEGKAYMDDTDQETMQVGYVHTH
jgi:hypothetical protein